MRYRMFGETKGRRMSTDCGERYNPEGNSFAKIGLDEKNNSGGNVDILKTGLNAMNNPGGKINMWSRPY